MADHANRLATAAKRYATAREHRDSAIRNASVAGMTYRAIGAIVGLSYSRVMQIVRERD